MSCVGRLETIRLILTRPQGLSAHDLHTLYFKRTTPRIRINDGALCHRPADSQPPSRSYSYGKSFTTHACDISSGNFIIQSPTLWTSPASIKHALMKALNGYFA